MIDVVMITTKQRTALLRQSLASLSENKHDHTTFSLNVVWDCMGNMVNEPRDNDVELIVGYGNLLVMRRTGASLARNIGASSIPKYRRQKYVMFLDDDVYMCPGWDGRLLDAANHFEPGHHAIYSGHAHPYNHTVFRTTSRYLVTNVISTVHMMMPWALWDDVGWFLEPGGPGGSEDVNYCLRATDKGFPLVITEPQCVIHTGLTSSSGKPIVGADQVRENNRRLEDTHHLTGKVVYQ